MQYGKEATVYFQIYTTSGTPTSQHGFLSRINASISKDGEIFVGCTNGVTYIGGTIFALTLTAAEMACKTFAIKFTDYSIYTVPPIIGETDFNTVRNQIYGLAGYFTVSGNRLIATALDGSSGTPTTFNLTRNTAGEITAITPLTVP